MLLGKGILTWDGRERQTNRYGSVVLAKTNYEGTAKVEVHTFPGAFRALFGKKVRLSCIVKEARKSGHIGDAFLKIIPSTPEEGEKVDLGVGILDIGQTWNPTVQAFALRPEDGREEFWIDPRQLYRLHDQTVFLRAVETDEPCSPVPRIVCEEPGIIDNGDGSIQVKRVGVPTRIEPDVEKLGDGLFVITPHTPRAGKRLRGA